MKWTPGQDAPQKISGEVSHVDSYTLNNSSFHLVDENNLTFNKYDYTDEEGTDLTCWMCYDGSEVVRLASGFLCE